MRLEIVHEAQAMLILDAPPCELPVPALTRGESFTVIESWQYLYNGNGIRVSEAYLYYGTSSLLPTHAPRESSGAATS